MTALCTSALGCRRVGSWPNARVARSAGSGAAFYTRTGACARDDDAVSDWIRTESRRSSWSRWVIIEPRFSPAQSSEPTDERLPAGRGVAEGQLATWPPVLVTNPVAQPRLALWYQRMVAVGEPHSHETAVRQEDRRGRKKNRTCPSHKSRGGA